MVSVGLSPSTNSILTLGSNFIDLYSSFVNVKYLNLSKASDELEISSLRKISLWEYKEWIISFSN